MTGKTYILPFDFSQLEGENELSLASFKGEWFVC